MRFNGSLLRLHHLFYVSRACITHAETLADVGGDWQVWFSMANAAAALVREDSARAHRRANVRTLQYARALTLTHGVQ